MSTHTLPANWQRQRQGKSEREQERRISVMGHIEKKRTDGLLYREIEIQFGDIVLAVLAVDHLHHLFIFVATLERTRHEAHLTVIE